MLMSHGSNSEELTHTLKVYSGASGEALPTTTWGDWKVPWGSQIAIPQRSPMLRKLQGTF